jgi:hypothetical protein
MEPSSVLFPVFLLITDFDRLSTSEIG